MSASKQGDRPENQQPESQAHQPESGAVDRQEQQDIRQSSPTNPRVQEKSEQATEEG